MNKHCAAAFCFLLLTLGITMTFTAEIQAQPANCVAPLSRTIVQINNIRASIVGGGIYWAGPPDGLSFEVPAGTGQTSFNAGAFWFGGIDKSGNLRVAAQTYRQASILGLGYWTGPLSTINGRTDSISCRRYDSLWTIGRTAIDSHKILYNSPNYQVPANIMHWPANGDITLGHSPILATFEDINGNNLYEPHLGETPAIFGDAALWQVYNDMGNSTTHGGLPIGLEVQEMIFGFNRPAPLNTALFHRFKIINRGTQALDSCFAGFFTEPAIGNPMDDFIGCDVNRSMGYVYNADNFDEGALGYGNRPPAAGIVFFEGLISDADDGLDNDLDGIIDNTRIDCNQHIISERFKMWNFISFSNDATVVGNPTQGIHAYRYLRSRWKTGAPMTFGGEGFAGSNGNTSIPARYQYPGLSDPNGFGIGGTVAQPVTAPFNWSESSINLAGTSNVPGIRRFVMAMGPVSMAPGAVQEITMGVVWARASSGGAQGSVIALQNAVDEIKTYFDDCRIFDNPSTVNIADLKRSGNLRLFPNPAREYAFITGNFEGVETLNLSLYNSSGQLVRKLSGVAVQDNRISIPLTDLAAGIYFVKVEAGAHERLLRLVKHH